MAIIKIREMDRAALAALAKDGKSPESRWLAARELKLRAVSA
jgi:hypothetical protein